MTSRSSSRTDLSPTKSSDTGTQPGRRRPVPEPRLPAEEITILDAYFSWLYEKIHDRLNLTAVCRLMHQVEFTPLVPFDENRVGVAAGLRNQFQAFAGSLGPAETAELVNQPVSVFEVLIGLADQANDQIPLTIQVWFHIFIENLGLDAYPDEKMTGRAPFHVEKIIHKFNNRQYRPDGRGGIFPMRSPQHDQREVELWYQWGAYATQERMY